MDDEEVQKKDGNWLDEHDSIQLELLKMKEDMMKTSKEPKKKKEEELEPISEEPPEKDDVEEEPIDTSFIPDSIKDREEKISTLPPEVESALKSSRNGSVKEKDPVKLDPGKIPASPELTNKIAKVIQLENKLKRRKFEMEKREREERSPKKENTRPQKKIEETKVTNDDKQRSQPPPPPKEPLQISEIDTDASNIQRITLEQDIQSRHDTARPETATMVPNENKKRTVPKNADQRRIIIRKRSIRKDIPPQRGEHENIGRSVLNENTDQREENEEEEKVFSSDDKMKKSRLSNLFKRKK
jgi:hypothetical protein